MECRFCLKQSPDVNIFELDLNILKVFIDMLKINEDDHLPKLICNNCVIKLKQIEKYVTLCKQSDVYLRKKLNQSIKTEPDYSASQYDYLNGVDCKIEIGKMEINYTEYTEDGDNTNNEHEDSPSEYQNDVTDNGADTESFSPIETKDVQISEIPKKTYGEFECSMCSKMLSNKIEYQNHVRSHAQKFACKLCPAKFANENRYNLHEKAHDNSLIFTCPICSKVFPTRRTLLRHVIVHHKDGAVVSKVVDDSPRKPKHKKIIKNKKEKPESILCPTCGKCFVDYGALRRHEDWHSSNLFECDICSKKFRTQKTITYHMLSRHNPDASKPYSCEICSKRFACKSFRSKHMRTVHAINKEVFVCKICNKGCATSYSLKIHTMIHTGERRHTCPICYKGYTLAAILNKHMFSHSEKRPFPCKYCPKTFKNPDYVKDHERLHTGDTPFKCPVCLRGYAQWCNMKSHFVHNHKDLDYKKEMENYKLRLKEAALQTVTAE